MTRDHAWLWIERLALAVGAALAVWCALVTIKFDQVSTLPIPPAPPSPMAPSSLATPVTITPAPGEWVARLEVPSIRLSATVLEGSDDRTLRLAAGHIEDTALPGQPGNVGIAGHRDTVFRPVQRLKPGDELDLTTQLATYHYLVTKTFVVSPQDVYVLDPGTQPMLTLVTCFPFQFIGHAPRRFIVQAVQVEPTP